MCWCQIHLQNIQHKYYYFFYYYLYLKYWVLDVLESWQAQKNEQKKKQLAATLSLKDSRKQTVRHCDIQI